MIILDHALCITLLFATEHATLYNASGEKHQSEPLPRVYGQCPVVSRPGPRHPTTTSQDKFLTISEKNDLGAFELIASHIWKQLLGNSEPIPRTDS